MASFKELLKAKRPDVEFVGEQWPALGKIDAGSSGILLMAWRAAKPTGRKFTGKQIAPVTTGQIYWGAVPFVGLQLLMVALIIGFPTLISVGSKIDMKEQLELNINMHDSDFGSETPNIQFKVEGDDMSEMKLDFPAEGTAKPTK